jgi:hypothetical protein
MEGRKLERTRQERGSCEFGGTPSTVQVFEIVHLLEGQSHIGCQFGAIVEPFVRHSVSQNRTSKSGAFRKEFDQGYMSLSMGLIIPKDRFVGDG